MGLDITSLEATDSLGTSYGGFHRFRTRLAASAGYGDIRDYEGYGGSKPWPESDVLVDLLNHSDCEGELRGYDIEGLADRIETIVRDWDEDAPTIFSDRTYGLRLAALCRRVEGTAGRLYFH